ncbi:Hypothetical protein POVN_LOCUS730 [uncultured virus]|nr:Hypothetical protein POVN_LOCUS730 [uncultured virus]
MGNATPVQRVETKEQAEYNKQADTHLTFMMAQTYMLENILYLRKEILDYLKYALSKGSKGVFISCSEFKREAPQIKDLYVSYPIKLHESFCKMYYDDPSFLTLLQSCFRDRFDVQLHAHSERYASTSRFGTSYCSSYHLDIFVDLTVDRSISEAYATFQKNKVATEQARLLELQQRVLGPGAGSRTVPGAKAI